MKALSLALSLIVTPASAETPCLPTFEDFAAALERTFEEVPQIIGTMNGGRGLIVFANPKTGTWTIVVESPDGQFCSPASGLNFIAAPQGDPT